MQKDPQLTVGRPISELADSRGSPACRTGERQITHIGDLDNAQQFEQMTSAADR